jgi:hypothetical protein
MRISGGAPFLVKTCHESVHKKKRDCPVLSNLLPHASKAANGKVFEPGGVGLKDVKVELPLSPPTVQRLIAPTLELMYTL